MGRISIITLIKYSKKQQQLLLLFILSFPFLFPQVGTGFSFADSLVGFSVNEVEVGENLYSALTQFFMVFSEYKDSDFYLTGEVRGRVVLCTSNALV